MVVRDQMNRCLWLSFVLLSALAVPVFAHADCHVPDTGIPEDAATHMDVAGMRKALAESGIGIGGFYAAETFGNPSGGFKRGATYDGVLELHLDGDLKKWGLWKGLCLHANGYQIHGRSITADYVHSLMTVSNLEATPATKLYELWLQQGLFNEHLYVRVGQLAADGDFLVSVGGAYFLDGTWGWPTLLAADLPSGGPAYPLATPGVRVLFSPNENFGLKAAVYNGDPVGPNCKGDPQVCDPAGLEFRLSDPPLLFAEGFYSYNQKRGLAGTIMLGGWNHFGSFEHQRFDIAGMPIAVTGRPGRPLDHDWGFYAVLDQLVWRVPHSEDVKGVGLFTRVIGAPSDRNLVDFYAEGGVTFTGMIAHRSDDSLAVGFAYADISDQVHGFDVDSGLPVARNYEALFEICYTAQIGTGWSLQPDFQYIVQPGGNVPNASGTGAVGNASVFGVRTTLNF
jgi:porin